MYVRKYFYIFHYKILQIVIINQEYLIYEFKNFSFFFLFNRKKFIKLFIFFLRANI